MIGSNEQYWSMRVNYEEMIRELDGGLREIRRSEPHGDAACATLGEIAFRSIPSVGVLRLPSDSEHSSIDAAIATMLDRPLAETREILCVLVNYGYLKPFPGGYVIPIVVKNLEPPNTDATRRRKEDRLAAVGKERLCAVLTALGIEDGSNPEKDSERAAASDEQAEKTDSIKKRRRYYKESQHGDSLKATDQAAAQDALRIAVAYCSGKSGDIRDLIHGLLKLLDMEKDSQGCVD